MSSIGCHSGVRSRAKDHVNPQQNSSHSGVSELVVFLPTLQQTPQQLLHQLEGKGRQRDQDGGIGDGEGLSLAPNRKDYVTELVEEREEYVEAVGREEVDHVLSVLGISLSSCRGRVQSSKLC